MRPISEGPSNKSPGNSGGELDQERRLTPRGGARFLHALEQRIERLGRLEIAQARRVGRGDVDGKIARHLGHARDALNIIADTVLAVAPGPEIDADDPYRAWLEPLERRVLALISEAEPGDDGAGGDRAEQ